MHYEGGILKRSISCCYQMCCSENVDVVGVAASPRRLILEHTSRNLSSCFFLTAAKHSAIINLTCLSAPPRHAPRHARQNTDSSQNGVNNMNDNQAPLIKSDIRNGGGGGSGAGRDSLESCCRNAALEARAVVSLLLGAQVPLGALTAPEAAAAAVHAERT